jgi:uncharacterized protein (DUF885 family)
VPPAIEAGAPGGYAAAGSIDGKVPGQYYINLRKHGRVAEILAPDALLSRGHSRPHLAGRICQSDGPHSLDAAFNAYSEGWALYSEQLADDLASTEDDPLGQLGYLQSSSFRACRLVVDTACTPSNWTRDRPSMVRVDAMATIADR